ncbi:MAG: TlpA disulfide reductase family protein [Mycobacteriales bacterium]
MTRTQAFALAAAAILSPLLITAVIVTAAGSFDDVTDNAVPQPKRPTSFNADTLPIVHLDRCPTGDALLPQPATGKDLLPDLTLECIGEHGSTDTLSLRRLGGVPTVINLWQTLCEPCKAEMPDLQEVYADAGGKVRVLGVNSKDDAGAARSTINLTAVRYPSVADPSDLVKIGVGAFAMPTTIFVSAQGRVVHVKTGQYPNAAAIKDDIAEHLGVRL